MGWAHCRTDKGRNYRASTKEGSEALKNATHVLPTAVMRRGEAHSSDLLPSMHIISSKLDLLKRT